MYIGLILSIIYFCYLVIVTVQILLRKRQSQIIISWLFTIYFLPYVGVVLYLLFGLDRDGRKIVKTIPEDLILQTFSDIHRVQREYIARDVPEASGNVRKNLSLLLSGGRSVITLGNRIVFQFSGKEHFESLLRDIGAAGQPPYILRRACSGGVFGPDSRWDILRKLYIAMLTGARERVYIQSPYFVPDESVLSALETAALGGVDVRLMIAGIPDKLVTFWVAENYFPSLLDAGLRIFRYNAGFFHAKTISADGEIAAVGSCNLDVRSLQIDYEMDAVLYDESLVKQLEDRFLQDCSLCIEITREVMRTYSFPVRLRNSLCKIIAPLL